MKKMILLLLAGIGLFAFIFVTSILWYRFFYVGNISNNEETVSSIKVNLGNNSYVLDETNLIPLDDETAKNIRSYDFSVTNDSNIDSVYSVLIEDSIINDNDSYTNKDLLSRNQLRYQLVLNNNLIKIGNLSEIEDNVLDTRVISNSQVNRYQLRVYVSEQAQNTSWQNKYYHFNINVQTEEF